MRTCYIHIGMHKTGSTSIQSSLLGYDDGRLAYLSLSGPNHSLDLMDMFFEEGRAAIGHLIPGGSLKAQRQQLFAMVESQLTGNEKNFIISGEELSGNLTVNEKLSGSNTESHVSVACDYLRGFFDRLVVIAYLREPYSFMASALQEISKRQRILFDATYQQVFPAYRRRLEPWLANVGADNMQFVCFDRRFLVGGDSVSDFAERVHADPTQVRQAFSNTSLSAEGVALLQYMMRLKKSQTLGAPTWIPQFITREAQYFGHTPFGIDIEKAKSIIDQHLSEVHWAEQQLGHSFPTFRPNPEALVFHDKAEMIRYARSCLPAFALHLVRTTKPHKRAARNVRGFFRRLRGRTPSG